MKSALAFLLPVVFLGLLALANANTNSGSAQVRKTTATSCVQETPGEVTSSPSGSSPTPASEYRCPLTDALRNVSMVLDGTDKADLDAFIIEIEITILRDISLTDEEKVVKCSYALKKFLGTRGNIHNKLAFVKIGSWGLFFHFFYVSIDIQADFLDFALALDGDDSCPMFEALLNATAGDPEKHSATIELIEEFKIILMDGSLTMAQKKSKIHLRFKAFFEVHVEWKSFFYSINIEGFGSLESLDDVCHGFDRAMSLTEVIGGSSDNDCELCLALTEAVANTSFSTSVRGQLKQFHDKIQAYFQTTVDIQLRLSYVSAQYYQMQITAPWIVESLFQMTLKVKGVKWGIFYDLLWVSQFCKNSGSCGNLNPATTMAPSTTPSGPDCADRPSLIAISTQNTTILTDAILQQYGTWNYTMKSGFNTCLNRVRNAIWNHVQFPTVDSKLGECVAALKAYNPNNWYKQSVVMNITIVSWNYDTIGDFCDC